MCGYEIIDGVSSVQLNASTVPQTNCQPCNPSGKRLSGAEEWMEWFVGKGFTYTLKRMELNKLH